MPQPAYEAPAYAADAAAAVAAAADDDNGNEGENEAEDESDTQEMLISDLVEFFSLSGCFANYTYRLNAASTPAATAKSNAYRLLTKINEQIGAILVARGAVPESSGR